VTKGKTSGFGRVYTVAQNKISRGVCILKKIILVMYIFYLYLNPWHVAEGGEVKSIGAPFLRIVQGARPSAMGGAFSAVSGDSNSGCWNPAGLALLDKQWRFHASSARLFQDITYYYGGLALHKARYGSLGLNLFYLKLGDLEFRTTKSDEYIRKFRAFDLVATVSYAVSFKYFLFGVNGKYLYDSIDSSGEGGTAFDLGLMYTSRFFKSAVVLKNVATPRTLPLIGDKLTYPYELPTTFVFGGNISPRRGLLIAVDYNYFRYRKDEIKFGIEYCMKNRAYIRAGYNLDMARDSYLDVNSFTFGLGADVNRYRIDRIDYALCPHPSLPRTHRVSLEFSWGDESKTYVGYVLASLEEDNIIAIAFEQYFIVQKGDTVDIYRELAGGKERIGEAKIIRIIGSLAEAEISNLENRTNRVRENDLVIVR